MLGVGLVKWQCNGQASFSKAQHVGSISKLDIMSEKGLSFDHNSISFWQVLHTVPETDRIIMVTTWHLGDQRITLTKG